jgi:uncharacterized damage-inducible protein DinB
MISPSYVQQMARYNTWQNESLYAAAAGLSDAARRAEHGAFWGSIHATLAHILWGDQMWMSRFAAWEKPAHIAKEAPAAFPEFDAMRATRKAKDAAIEAWANDLSADNLSGDLAWFSGAMKRDVRAPRWVCVTHFFNHQTHHRGQAHALLTAAGAKPDDTDLFLMAAQ